MILYMCLVSDTIKWSQRWCAVWHIMKSDISPIFFNDIINWECFWEVILYPFIGHLKKDRNANSYFQQDSANAHTGCVSMTLLCDVFGNSILSKDIWPLWVPNLTSWLTTVRNNERHSLWRQFSHLLWTEGSHCKFHHEHPYNWIASCHCKQDM